MRHHHQKQPRQSKIRNNATSPTKITLINESMNVESSEKQIGIHSLSKSGNKNYIHSSMDKIGKDLTDKVTASLLKSN